MKVIAEYETERVGVLSIHEDDVIEVITQSEDGWWTGRLRGQVGFFPINHCKVIIGPKINIEAGIEHIHLVNENKLRN